MQRIYTEHGIFTENEELGLSAEEVYQEWLKNRDKPGLPSVEERLQQVEDAILFLLMGGI